MRYLIESGRYAVILLAAGFALLPVVWMTTLAFKPILEWNVAGGAATWLPKTPTLTNFVALFAGPTPFGGGASHAILASLMSATFGTLLAGGVGTLAAYAVSRFKLLPSIGLAALMLRLFPPLVFIVPVMVMWTYLDLIDTWMGMALIYGTLNVPFSYWLMKTFFDEVPIEIEEAALVEGCSHWRAFVRVTLPMVRAPLATTGLFVFILCWSDYSVARILTNHQWVTVPVFLDGLTTYGPKAAMGVIATLPPIVLGLLIQRDLVRGLTFGALKQ